MENTVSSISNLTEADFRARNWGLIGYALQGLGVIIVISLFIGIVLNYWMKEKGRGTISESHFQWQRRTFWWTLALLVVGILTAYIYLGYLLIFGGALLLVVRTFWGAIQLYRCQSM